MLTCERQTLVNNFLSLSPSSLARGLDRRGTSIAGVLMLGLAVISISLESKNNKYPHAAATVDVTWNTHLQLQVRSPVRDKSRSN